MRSTTVTVGSLVQAVSHQNGMVQMLEKPVEWAQEAYLLER